MHTQVDIHTPTIIDGLTDIWKTFVLHCLLPSHPPSIPVTFLLYIFNNFYYLASIIIWQLVHFPILEWWYASSNWAHWRIEWLGWDYPINEIGHNLLPQTSGVSEIASPLTIMLKRNSVFIYIVTEFMCCLNVRWCINSILGLCESANMNWEHFNTIHRKLAVS